MRLFPRTRWGVARLLLIIGLALLIFSPSWWLGEARETLAFVVSRRVSDRAGVVPLSEEWQLERFLQRMEDESGVDIRFLLVPAVTGESLEAYGVRMARSLGVGRDADRRGLLFVYDVADRRLRLEVGAQMEPVITDAFSGYLMREHVRNFFGAGNPPMGIRTTLFMVQQRLREAVLGQDYDPRPVRYIDDVRRLALGGGASTVIHAEAGSGFLNTDRTSARSTRMYFSPQPTPDLAYVRYVEWMARGRYETDVPLFTPVSQEYMAGQPMTRAFNDYILMAEYGQPYRIDERGDLALLYFTTTPLVGPHFLRRTPAGWTVDIWTEVLDTRNYAGGWYTWGLYNAGDDFAQRFDDRFIDMGGVLRVAGGDNRTLPSRAYPNIKPQPAPSPVDTVVQLTVEEAAAEIGATGPRTLVILYYGWGAEPRTGLPALAALAAKCRDEGVDLRAYAMPQGATARWLLPERLREVHAPFPPRQLRQWEPGSLSRAMSPLGIDIGTEFSTPLLAVRVGGSGTVAQVEGYSALAGRAKPIAAACAAATPR
jgi:uncharacterized membrane protein YgcG